MRVLYLRNSSNSFSLVSSSLTLDFKISISSSTHTPCFQSNLGFINFVDGGSHVNGAAIGKFSGTL